MKLPDHYLPLVNLFWLFLAASSSVTGLDKDPLEDTLHDLSRHRGEAGGL